MRVALVSPMPPSPSGIADYSEALAAHLERLVELTVIPGSPERFEPDRFDLVLYQIGNNGEHGFAYEMAIEHPGVVVLHEANLHHLIAELTIKRGDWDRYLDEVAYEGGPQALEHARRVRALETGPDYDGLPMTRRLLERSRALIVHSRYMEERMRAAGFTGPIARIPHGAWTDPVNGLPYRLRLGLDETTPLAGVFGHLKPYKRIPEVLRAFRRLVRVEPRARMILVGQPHPELPLDSLLERLELLPFVRVLGRVPIEDFMGYLAACDIVINLRYPSVGETSGTLLRALGLGKCVLVSDTAAFCELPDEICWKVPVDQTEEEVLYELLHMAASRAEVRRKVGEAARAWALEHCRWERVAGEYAAFLESLAAGVEWRKEEPSAAAPSAAAESVPAPASAEEILGWAARDEETRSYAETHLTRFEKTLAITPPGGPEDRVLEIGSYLQITPLLKTRLGYGEVRGCYYGPAGKVDHRSVVSASGERFECDLELFDAEKDRFPYPDAYFTTVLCCEVIEHLTEDPMHMMAEINRVLKPGGHLVLTTPNIASLRAIAAVLEGYHPALFPAYIRPTGSGEKTAARHNREYTPKEIHLLLGDAGFEVVRLETGPFREQPRPELAWVRWLLERFQLSTELRGDGIYAVGRKTGPVRRRFPAWLYSDPEA
ncbi:MAG TPA: methyltransferase domain-containing protein [Bryobacteraceae bacterium]|nr:methyltransferase domain-containing protein [Bryobacteraceae bacterium]